MDFENGHFWAPAAPLNTEFTLGNTHCLNAVLQHIAAYLQLQQQKVLKIPFFVKMPKNR